MLDLEIDCIKLVMTFFVLCRFNCTCLCIIRIKSKAQLWLRPISFVCWWRDYWLQRWLTRNCQKEWNSGLLVYNTITCRNT